MWEIHYFRASNLLGCCGALWHFINFHFLPVFHHLFLYDFIVLLCTVLHNNRKHSLCYICRNAKEIVLKTHQIRIILQPNTQDCPNRWKVGLQMAVIWAQYQRINAIHPCVLVHKYNFLNAPQSRLHPYDAREDGIPLTW